jgi:hypothetical protein
LGISSTVTSPLLFCCRRYSPPSFWPNAVLVQLPSRHIVQEMIPLPAKTLEGAMVNEVSPKASGQGAVQNRIRACLTAADQQRVRELCCARRA